MTDWGVFSVARDIWDHPLFLDEPLTKREAWMWLISAAAYKPTYAPSRSGPVRIERGEFCYALRFLARKWQWLIGRVERFLDTLEKHLMIRDASRDEAKIYYINNYERFQLGSGNKRDALQGENETLARRSRDKEETIQTIQSSNPSSLRSEGARKPRRKTATEPSLPDWVPQEPWQAFVEMRRKIRAPLTEDAVPLAISKLEKLRASGQDPGEVLEQSVMRAWRGLFAIKDDENDQGRSRKTNGHGHKPNAHDAFLSAAAQLATEDRQRSERSGNHNASKPIGPALLASRLHGSASEIGDSGLREDTEPD